MEKKKILINANVVVVSRSQKGKQFTSGCRPRLCSSIKLPNRGFSRYVIVAMLVNKINFQLHGEKNACKKKMY